MARRTERGREVERAYRQPPEISSISRNGCSRLFPPSYLFLASTCFPASYRAPEGVVPNNAVLRRGLRSPYCGGASSRGRRFAAAVPAPRGS